jgi:hypothetical protein
MNPVNDLREGFATLRLLVARWWEQRRLTKYGKILFQKWKSGDGNGATEAAEAMIEGYTLKTKSFCPKCHGRGRIGTGADGMPVVCGCARAVKKLVK